MKEKLIKLLYHASCESELEGEPGSCPYRKHGRCGEVERLDYCAVQHLADHLIANGVTFCDEVEDLKATVVNQRKRADTAERDIEKITRCKDCADRWNCQIRIQCMGDEDFCSLGTREE